MFLGLATAFFCAALLGASELFALTSPASSSRMVPLRHLLIVVILGSFIGVLALSPMADFATKGNMAWPFISALVGMSLCIPLLWAGVPVSPVQILMAAFMGASAVGSPLNSMVDLTLIWCMAPLGAAIFARVLYRWTARLVQKLQVNIFKLDRILRTGTLLVTGLSAFLVAANNLPLLGAVLNETVNTPEELLFISGWRQLCVLAAAMAVLGHLLSTRILAHPFDETLYQYRSAPLPALVALVSTATLFSLFTFSGLPLLLSKIGITTPMVVPLSVCQILMGATLGLSSHLPSWRVKGRTLGWTALVWILGPWLAFAMAWISRLLMASS